MRWFLGLVLVVALVTGALYGVGRFLLPNTLEVTRTVSVERPRAAIFAMMNDLRIAREWSPYYARDPDAEFRFSGDPGPGQSMRWSSSVREIGEGRMSIVDSTYNEQVEAILEMGDRATLNSRQELRPGDGATSVAWTVSAQCAEGNINVPCRYMNLVMRGRIEQELDAGLARLKTLAEQLPNVDFEGFDIVATPVEAQDVIFVDVTIGKDNPTFEDRETAERDGIAALNLFINSAGGQVTSTGQLVRVFPANNGAGGRYSFSVGYPYSGPAPLRLVGVRVGQTPGGPTLRAMFVGRRSQLPLMYQRLDAYMQAHRIAPRPGAEAWEIVRQVEAPAPDSQFPNDPIEHTEIYFPIA
jgi:hypothetical protein